MGSDNNKNNAHTLSSIERHLMAASMGALCVLTMANVLVRYFTDLSFAFTEEISVVLMVIMTLVGASHAFATNHHISILYFVERKPALRKAAIKLAAGERSLRIIRLAPHTGACLPSRRHSISISCR